MLINVDKDSDASTLQIQIPDSADQQWIFKRQYNKCKINSFEAGKDHKYYAILSRKQREHNEEVTELCIGHVICGAQEKCLALPLCAHSVAGFLLLAA